MGRLSFSKAKSSLAILKDPKFKMYNHYIQMQMKSKSIKSFILIFSALFFIFFSALSQNDSVQEESEASATGLTTLTDESIIIKRTAKNTVTPVLLNQGDVLEFTLNNGQKRTVKLLETNASVMRTNVKDMDIEQANGGTIAEFTCKVLIDGHLMTMQRYLPTQESFYEPYVINGMRIWFDAVGDYFDFFTLKHGWARPRADVRLAVSDAKDPVAPDVDLWYPNKDLFIDVKDSYLGDDVWMGPYWGGSPHAGLDINTPKGTPLFAPIDFDDQWLQVNFDPKPYYWAATMQGVRNWENGSIWTLKVLHLDKYLVELHTPLEKGDKFAEAAGTGVGQEEHSHFEFMIRDESTNTVDGRVMVKGQVLSERDSIYFISVNGIHGEVPQRSALYIRREDRPMNLSTFMIPEKLAVKNRFYYEVPQVPLDPWMIFWQAFENEKSKEGAIRAHFALIGPVKTGETVSFSSAGSKPENPSGELNNYWTFGDGGWSNNRNPTYIFGAPGIYPVTLIVDDGIKRDQFTQTITVDGKRIKSPALSLTSPREPSFDNREPYVMDVYGMDVPFISHTLYFVARQSNPKPEHKKVVLVNTGGGELSEISMDIEYEGNENWVDIIQERGGKEWSLNVSVDAENLSPGLHIATVQVKSPGALNSPQSFRVSLNVRSDFPKSEVVVDDRDSGFFATPYFWVGSKFKYWNDGYNNFYLTNGGRAKEGEYFKFTPDLRKGKYKVSFTSETPFQDGRFKVLVHSAEGDKFLWIEPTRSRVLGEFYFSEGMEGFVKVFAEGSEGEIIADAVKFERIGT